MASEKLYRNTLNYEPTDATTPNIVDTIVVVGCPIVGDVD